MRKYPCCNLIWHMNMARAARSAQRIIFAYLVKHAHSRASWAGRRHCLASIIYSVAASRISTGAGAAHSASPARGNGGLVSSRGILLRSRAVAHHHRSGQRARAIITRDAAAHACSAAWFERFIRTISWHLITGMALSMGVALFSAASRDSAYHLPLAQRAAKRRKRLIGVSAACVPSARLSGFIAM